MTTPAGLPPIPGTLVDPLPTATPDALVDLDASDGAASTAAGIGYRAMTRFTESSATLLAAGTTYYVFLAMFSLIALAYGIAALLGADSIANYLTIAISEAFPDLLGDEGIDPAQLRSLGQAASIVGLVMMLYAGGGAMASTSDSVHTIYGAPKDPRNFLTKRVRLLGWLLVIAPLIVFSLAAETVALRFGGSALSALGFESSGALPLVIATSIVLSLAANFAVVYIVLGKLGGIRPPRHAHLVGAALGAIGVQLLSIPMGFIVSISVDKPQFGALTTPIGVMLVLYLNTLVVYGAAAITAGIAERDVPLEEIVPTVDLGETRIIIPEE